jgi:RAB protein geranylgeranyltransferase component A
MAYSAGPFVDTLIKSGAHQYLEFKALEGTLIMGDKGLVPVPFSRCPSFHYY